MNWVRRAVVVLVGSVAPLWAQESVKLACLKGPVEVTFDAHGIPHVFADSWRDAYRVLGWLHVNERLVQMEFNRRVATGTLAELVGPDGIEADKLARRLGLLPSSQEVWNSTSIPDEMKGDLLAYAEGVNETYEQVKKSGLPALAKLLGIDPKPWQPAESLAFNKYMGWDQGGTSDDLWFGRMVQKFGKVATDELWPMDRPYEIPIVRKQFDRAKIAEQSVRTDPIHQLAVASLSDALLDQARQAVDGGRWFPRSHSFGSNNWAIDGTKTKSGKPILCNDPHLGFRLPSIFYACHLSVKGENIAGVTFPGGPIIVIGHNDRVTWGITNMQADAVDYFIETIAPDRPRQYKHEGTWKEMEVVTETIAVKGSTPVEYVIERTVHGPIIAREEQAISMQWTGFGPTTEGVGLWRLNRAKNTKDYLAALDLVSVPCLNLIYADVDGNIALHPMGRLPRRAPGAGRTPMDGSVGTFDWKEWIPRSELPLAVNPAEHFVASANGRPQPLGYPHYVGWMWDDSYRTRRIDQLLREAKEMDIDQMKRIQTDAYDLAASIYVPLFLKVVDPQKTTPFGQDLLKALAEWDYVADVDSLGTLIWLRWFENYRIQVWEDEWAGLPKESGSWGFNGNNKREPMLEVLEQLTREKPDSHWFDDTRTPSKESRDDMIRRSFALTVEQLNEQSKGKVPALAWKNFNVLQIPSLTELPAFSRRGGPVVGDEFTVNPGGGGGPVGGGACWRMIVDMANVSQSVGVYPGGQSGDPRSKQYADLMPIWAKGEYLPIHMVGSAADLPAEAKVRTKSFAP